MVFISMMDRENANFDRAFQQVRDSFGSGAIPVEVPIGSGDQFSGIVNLFSGHAHNYRPGSDKGEYDHIEVPDEVAATVAAYREQLIESIAATDDELLEAYLEGEELDRDRVLDGMKKGMARGELFPVFCGSGTTGRGARAVLKKLVELMPAPTEIGTVEAQDSRGNAVELEPADASPMTALVFKTTQEPRVGELTYFRVFSGTVRGGMTVSNPGRSAAERLSHPAIPDGADRSEVEVLHAGDIGVMDRDGYIEIVDRKMDMILVSGFNVGPSEIEEGIVQHPGVTEVGVIGIPDEKTGEAVKAFIVSSDPALTAEQVLAHCNQSLTNYKRPRHIQFVEVIPKSPVGKDLRRNLREMHSG